MENSPMSLIMSIPVNNPSARKLLRQFSEVLDGKPKTATRRLGAAKSKRKATITVIILWSNIPKRRGY